VVTQKERVLFGTIYSAYINSTFQASVWNSKGYYGEDQSLYASVPYGGADFSLMHDRKREIVLLECQDAYVLVPLTIPAFLITPQVGSDMVRNAYDGKQRDIGLMLLDPASFFECSNPFEIE